MPVVQFLRGIGIERVRVIPGNRDYLAGGPGPARPVDSDLNYFLVAPDTPDMGGSSPSGAAQATTFLEFFADVDFFERLDDTVIVGLDSEPILPEERLRTALAYFEASSPKLTRVFCTHRSLLPVPRKKLKEGDVLTNAGDILAALLNARVNVVLCAHLHRVNAWQLSDGVHSMAVINAPSLLDVSPGKETGLLVHDIGKRGELRVTLHSLDDTPPRSVYSAGYKREKGKR